jgi:ubiquitin-like-conjugating enzyme ATG3
MNMFQNVREYLTPVLAESGFLTDGVLTPEEFVAAGDQLCYKCPTWRWEGGDVASRKMYLPPNKQFLRTTGVPCRRRVTSLEYDYAGESVVPDEDGDWMETHNNNLHLNGDQTERLQHISMEAEAEAGSAKQMNILSSMVDEHFHIHDDVPDLNSFEDTDNIVETDEASLAPYIATSEPDPMEHDADGNLVYTRTYDLSISYDKYYRTPRVWLFGYEESGAPLKPEDMLQDIMQVSVVTATYELTYFIIIPL